jgi:hypothetical protein
MTPQPIRPLPSHRRLLLLWTVLLVGVGAASCSTTVIPGATLWTADVQPLTLGGAQGHLAVVSQSGATQASMDLNLGDPGVTYSWRMSKGTCASEGQMVSGRAAYPALVANAQGSATANAALAGELTSGGSYAARILQDPGTGTEEVVACGELLQTK